MALRNSAPQYVGTADQAAEAVAGLVLDIKVRSSICCCTAVSAASSVLLPNLSIPRSISNFVGPRLEYLALLKAFTCVWWAVYRVNHSVCYYYTAVCRPFHCPGL